MFKWLSKKDPLNIKVISIIKNIKKIMKEDEDLSSFERFQCNGCFYGYETAHMNQFIHDERKKRLNKLKKETCELIRSLPKERITDYMVHFHNFHVHRGEEI